MAEIRTPKEWTLRGLVRWAAAVLFFSFGGLLVEENARNYIEERHWETLWARVIGWMPDLSPLVNTEWFWSALCISGGFAGGVWLDALLRRGPSDPTGSDDAVGADEPPAVSPLLAQYGASDFPRLDAALYEIFEVISKVGAVSGQDAERNLVHNWEMKLADALVGPESFRIEARRLRTVCAECAAVIHDLLYRRYSYYLEELRDASMEAGSTAILGELDRFVIVLGSLPERLSVGQARVLFGDHHARFSGAVADYRKWSGDALGRIRQKREAIAELSRGSPS